MADLLDLLTLVEAKKAINANGHDTELAQVLTAVSRVIDERCGPVVNRTITSELHDGGRGVIRPRKTPVSAVTTLTEYASTTSTALTAESNASKPASGYLLDADRHNVKIIRRASGSDTRFAAGRLNVELTYVAGRYENTVSVDAKFKTAAASILRRLWDREAGAWARGADPFETGSTMATARFFDAVKHIVSEQLNEERTPADLGLLVG